MADFTKLNNDIAAVSAKIDAQNTLVAELKAQLAAAVAPPAPVDDQPAVDAADAAVEALLAKLP